MHSLFEKSQALWAILGRVHTTALGPERFRNATGCPCSHLFHGVRSFRNEPTTSPYDRSGTVPERVRLALVWTHNRTCSGHDSLAHVSYKWRTCNTSFQRKFVRRKIDTLWWIPRFRHSHRNIWHVCRIRTQFENTQFSDFRNSKIVIFT